MMVETIIGLLQEYEQKKESGKINTFYVKVVSDRLTMVALPLGVVPESSIPLDADLLQTLQIFFSDVDGIPCDTFDYTTLKSLLNAHGTLERMAQLNFKKEK